jgi:hypothetical protein
MEDPQSELNQRFDQLLSLYGKDKVNLYASNVSPRNKALCYLAGLALAAQTTIAIAKVGWPSHVFVLATAVIVAVFISRRE